MSIASYAELRASKMGNQVGNVPTCPSTLRSGRHKLTGARCERFSQLEHRNYDGLRSDTHHQDVKRFCVLTFHNLNFIFYFNTLRKNSSCECEPTPFGGGVRLRLRLAHPPLPRGPGGFARPPPVETNDPT